MNMSDGLRASDTTLTGLSISWGARLTLSGWKSALRRRGLRVLILGATGLRSESRISVASAALSKVILAKRYLGCVGKCLLGTGPAAFSIGMPVS